MYNVTEILQLMPFHIRTYEGTCPHSLSLGYKNEFEFAQLLVAYNSDGRAACSTISQGTTAFRWEQNTQMEKSENII